MTVVPRVEISPVGWLVLVGVAVTALGRAVLLVLADVEPVVGVGFDASSTMPGTGAVELATGVTTLTMSRRRLKKITAGIQRLLQ